MEFTAKQIATVLDGQIVGDENVLINKFSKLQEGEKGSISFLSNAKYTNYIYNTKASVVIVNKSFDPENQVSATMIQVEDAYQAFTKLLTFYQSAKQDKKGVDKNCSISDSAIIGKDPYIGSFAFIGDDVKIGDNVKIYPHVYIGDNVVIGDNTTLFSGVKIYSDCEIGSNTILHSSVIIGSDGFGFAPNEDGSYNKIPQIGNVVIGNDVEIGAASTIDRATMGTTRIGNGVKLDNQIQIAHNVEVGEHTVIAAQTGIAGSTIIGKHCVFGGQVGIAGHITIGDYVKIQAQSGIGKNIKDKEIVQGSPAFNYGDWHRSYVYFKNLPKTIRTLETDIKKIKKSSHD